MHFGKSGRASTVSVSGGTRRGSGGGGDSHVRAGLVQPRGLGGGQLLADEHGPEQEERGAPPAAPADVHHARCASRLAPRGDVWVLLLLLPREKIISCAGSLFRRAGAARGASAPDRRIKNCPVAGLFLKSACSGRILMPIAKQTARCRC